MLILKELNFAGT